MEDVLLREIILSVYVLYNLERMLYIIIVEFSDRYL